MPRKSKSSSTSTTPITVVDDGRGIPVDMKTLPNGEQMSAVEVVLTKLHAGGKFDASTYKVSGGLHGVGVSCVNALSQEFNVEIWRDGYTWERTSAVAIRSASCARPAPARGAAPRSTFLPDKSIFTVTEYNYDTLAQRLRELAFLNKGLEITLTDERTADPKTGESKHAEFKYAGGIAEFVKHLNSGKQRAARQADHDGSRARRRRDRDRAAVQRQLLGDGLQLRQQHQHGGRRHASLRASAPH